MNKNIKMLIGFKVSVMEFKAAFCVKYDGSFMAELYPSCFE